MQRCQDLYGQNKGERLDTVEGPYDLYGQEVEDEEQKGDDDDFADMKDSLESDNYSDDENPDADLGLGAGLKAKKREDIPSKVEVNFDDIPDDDD